MERVERGVDCCGWGGWVGGLAVTRLERFGRAVLGAGVCMVWMVEGWR